MKAFALVQGPRRKVLCVSESTIDLWIKGAAMLRSGKPVTDESTWSFQDDKNLCRAAGAYIVRVEFRLLDPITTPKKRKQKPAERGGE
jgi:hypothetical protein